MSLDRVAKLSLPIQALGCVNVTPVGLQPAGQDAAGRGRTRQDAAAEYSIFVLMKWHLFLVEVV